MLYLNEPGSVRRSPSCNTGVTPLRHDEQEDAAVGSRLGCGRGPCSILHPTRGGHSIRGVVISPRRWCLRAWVVPWASLATRDCACRRRLRAAGGFLLRVVRGAFEALCDALCCGSSGMSHAIPSHVCRGLKWGRWDCNVRGGATESSVARIACDLWVVRPWIELLCSFVGPRMLPTIPGVRQACARQVCCVAACCVAACCVLRCCLLRAALLLAACCVAGRGCGGARGLVWFCGPGVLRVVGWWCGSGREPCVGSRPGRLSGKSAVERDISNESIRQAEIALSKAEKRPETI